MFSLLRMAMTLLICILAVGFYLGWFSFSHSPPDPQTNKVNINVLVDENKVRTDLQKAEQNLSTRIQAVNNQSQGPGVGLPPGQQPAAPRLNFGPISLQPSSPVAAQPGQPAPPTWSLGPFSLQPASHPAGPPSGPPAVQPQVPAQGPDYQYSVPLGVPPPGEGR